MGGVPNVVTLVYRGWDNCFRTGQCMQSPTAYLMRYII